MDKESAQPVSAVSKALNMLKRIRRLDGSALISGGVFLHEDCPRGTDLKMFLQSVVQMFDQYGARNETAKEVLLGFADGEILFIFRYPVILCLFFHREEELHSIEAGGKQFLNQFSAILGVRDRPAFKPAIGGAEWSDERFRSALTPPPGARVVRPKNGVAKPDDKLSLKVPKTIAVPEKAKKEPKPGAVKSMIAPAPEPVVEPVSAEEIRPLTRVEDEPEKKPDVEESKAKKEPTRAVHLDSTQSIRIISGDAEWGEFLCHVENMFTKVIGSAQARTNIARELEAFGISEENGLEKSDYLSFSQKLTGRIKDRKVRRLIENELNTLIKKYNS